jgi:hypothetical protein
MFLPINHVARRRAELLAFPAGKNDDFCDALGLCGQLMDRMVVGQKPKPPEKPKSASGYVPRLATAEPGDWLIYALPLMIGFTQWLV